MMKVKAPHVITATGLLIALGIAYLATKTAGPVQLTQFVEDRTGGLAEHLVTLEQLGYADAKTPHRYPDKVAPGITSAIHHGFTPLYRIENWLAALPAEQG